MYMYVYMYLCMYTNICIHIQAWNIFQCKWCLTDLHWLQLENKQELHDVFFALGPMKKIMDNCFWIVINCKKLNLEKENVSGKNCYGFFLCHVQLCLHFHSPTSKLENAYLMLPKYNQSLFWILLPLTLKRTSSLVDLFTSWCFRFVLHTGVFPSVFIHL